MKINPVEILTVTIIALLFFVIFATSEEGEAMDNRFNPVELRDTILSLTIGASCRFYPDSPIIGYKTLKVRVASAIYYLGRKLGRKFAYRCMFDGTGRYIYVWRWE